MNHIFGYVVEDRSQSVRPRALWLVLAVVVLGLLLVGVFWLYGVVSFGEEDVEVNQVIMTDEVAQSYGVPVVAFAKLALWFEENGFNERYGGVGLYCVKPGHAGWLSGSVLVGADVDLEDDLQNAQVAAFLLKKFHDSGYDWEGSFLIYVYGFPAVHDRGGHVDFLDFVFGGN